MSSRARTIQTEEVPMLIQEKISAPDTLLKLYGAIDEGFNGMDRPLTQGSQDRPE
jgi:hypothetical protein